MTSDSILKSYVGGRFEVIKKEKESGLGDWYLVNAYPYYKAKFGSYSIPTDADTTLSPVDDSSKTNGDN